MILVIVALALCAFTAGAGWMYLPMRRWADATPLQQHPRYRAALHGDMRPGRAFNRPNQSAEDLATGHNILLDRPRFATSSEIAAGNMSADNFELGVDEPAHNKGTTIMLKSLICCCLCLHQSAWPRAECTCGAGYRA